MKWTDVTGWTMSGGSFIGTKKQTPANMLPKVAAALKKYNINGLLIVGGFEGFHSALIMDENRGTYKEFCIPIVVFPCTISNNVPGTSFTLGSDSALNEICGQIEKIKQSATGTKKRVFIIETMGGYCGYLATVSALAGGADNAYIYEEKFTVDDIKVTRVVGVIARREG
jgi:6-phosphofructokinase 1